MCSVQGLASTHVFAEFLHTLTLYQGISRTRLVGLNRPQLRRYTKLQVSLDPDSIRIRPSSPAPMRGRATWFGLHKS